MQNGNELAVLFADVVGSTELFERLGDLKARDTIANCLVVMKKATESHGGTVVKTIGDEVMSTFPDADEALNAAREMQAMISTGQATQDSGVEVSIRIGCDYGPVVPDDHDVFGTTVHTANRMTSQAKADQIITTSTMVEQLGPEWRASVRQIDLAPIKGKSGDVAMFEVLWQSEDVTSMLPGIQWASRQAQASASRLRVSFQNQEYMVSADNPKITMGRSEDNHLVVKGNLISRLHATVQHSRGKFMLVDQSTNGSFVVTREGNELFVRRDNVQLTDEGVIGLGRVVQPGSAQAIHFILEE